MSNDINVEGQIAVFDLAFAINDAWMDANQVVSLIPSDLNELISYNDFYDTMSQFGFDQKVELRTVYKYLEPSDREMPTKSHARAVIEKASIKLLRYNTRKAKTESETPEGPKYEKAVALVAHNNMKPAMMNFVSQYLNFFKKCKLVTTGSTGRALTSLGLTVDHLVSSGPLGGDQEIGGMVSKGEVAAVFFFIDPLSAHPHADDIAALIRICAVHDVITANNPSTGHAMMFALQSSAYGLSVLKGLNPDMACDSHVVKSYKEGQQQVIANVSHSNLGKPEEPEDFTQSLDNLSLRKTGFSHDDLKEGSLMIEKHLSQKRKSKNLFFNQGLDAIDEGRQAPASSRGSILFAESLSLDSFLEKAPEDK